MEIQKSSSHENDCTSRLVNTRLGTQGIYAPKPPEEINNIQAPSLHTGLGLEPHLNQEHLEKLQESALSDQHLFSLSWRSLSNGRLEITYLQPDGSPEQCFDGSTPFKRWRLPQVEVDKAKAQGKKGAKYLSPSDNGCRIYHSHLAIKAGGYAERLKDRLVPLRITEGELKTEAATAHDPDRLTIGLGGVSSWQDRRAGGENSAPLPDLLELELDGREVRLCFDSDLGKPQVAHQLRALSELLKSCGAHVLIEVLPNGLNGERLGVDDLIYRHGDVVFREIASIARCPFQKKSTTVEWGFSPEPRDTRERNVYLFGLLGDHWKTLDGNHRWRRWTGTHWEEVNGDSEIDRELERFAVLQGWRNRELVTINSLKAAFRRSVGAASEVEPQNLIPLKNGCLKLPELKLIPHDPHNGNSWCLPYVYDPVADCRGIQDFLSDRLGDPATVEVYRAFARGLITDTRLKCFIEISGPSNTGKSVLTNLLTALVGTSNTQAGKLHRIENPSCRFETIGLKGKRLAVFSECQDFSGQLQTLKAVTGGDPIAAEIKHGPQLHFVFTGGVVLTGNGPIRASDPTGAVINRRRSVHVTKVVAASDERQLLDPDGQGGWRGELVKELPGFLNWCLDMTPEDAAKALARDVRSIARAEAELQTMLDSDPLIDWADQTLVFSPEGFLRVGREGDDSRIYLFANYRRFIDGLGPNGRPLSMRTFKAKLVDLLRDTLGLPLPAGSTRSGEYKQRGLGSVVPCVAWKGEDSDEPGIIRAACIARATEMPPERFGNREPPLGNGRDGWNESDQSTQEKNHSAKTYTSREKGSTVSIPVVPSVPRKGSAVTPAIPGMPSAFPVGSGADAMASEDDPHWGPRPQP